MAKTKRSERREDALSKARIVEAAIALLDGAGESALTFRALAARLATGSGAIYWHVADKGELLAAATDEIIARALAGVGQGDGPRETIRVIALRVFDAIDAHPWVGAQLYREPWRAAMLQIFEGIGGRLAALGVPAPAQFDVACAILHYILGVAGQNAANARLQVQATSRLDFLSNVAAQWANLDAAAYPFARRVAPQLAEHDDRDQFLAGLDLVLAGLGASTPDAAG